MPQTHADLLRELTGVSETFTRLSEKLSEVASELRVSGIPPASTIVEELAQSRSNFEELRNRALELAGALAATSAKRPEEVGSLKDLKALLHSLSEAQDRKAADEKIKEQALNILDRILVMVHREGTEFQPLIDCQAKAGELRAAVADLSWPDLHPEATLLAHRRHPFAEFLTLVEEHDRLDDDLWMLLKHAVSESFGKSLSLAAARGRLHTPRVPKSEGSATSLSLGDDTQPAMEPLDEATAPNGKEPVALAEEAG